MTKATRSTGKRALTDDGDVEDRQSPAKKPMLKSFANGNSPDSPLTSDDGDGDLYQHTASSNVHSATPASTTALVNNMAEGSVHIPAASASTNAAANTSRSSAAATKQHDSANTLKLGTWESHCDARWDSKLKERIPYFLSHADTSTHRYSIAALPSISTNWVCKEQARKNNHTLCVASDSPLIVWITGEVKCALFHYAGGEPWMRASMQVIPIHEGDRLKIINYIRNLASVTKGDTDDQDGVWASHYQGHRSRGNQKPCAREFTNCFNGTVSFGAHAEMKRHPAICIVENDLVLLKCNITCFKCNANGDAVYDGGWKLWRTQLELLTISKLFDGPEPSIKEDVGMTDDVLI